MRLGLCAGLWICAAASAAAQDRVEDRYAERASSSFVLAYDGKRLEPGVERTLLSALERAYADLVQDLGSAPSSKITVVVYAERDWRTATQAPDWSGGMFDGRVRVPAQGLSGVTPGLLAVLKHEMTHAFVFARAGARAPTWLHEGLAQLEEGRSSAPYAAALVEARKAAGSFRLPELEGSFLRFSGPQARGGYAVSLAAVEMLRDTRGPGALAHFVDRLGEGLAVEDAMRESLRADYQRLDADLVEWLSKKR